MNRTMWRICTLAILTCACASPPTERTEEIADIPRDEALRDLDWREQKVTIEVVNAPIYVALEKIGSQAGTCLAIATPVMAISHKRVSVLLRDIGAYDAVMIVLGSAGQGLVDDLALRERDGVTVIDRRTEREHAEIRARRAAGKRNWRLQHAIFEPPRSLLGITEAPRAPAPQFGSDD